MPIPNYGVWVGTPTSYNAPSSSDESPHLDLQFKDSKGSYYANINVESGDSSDSRLVYWNVTNLPSSLTTQLQALDPGYHALPPTSDLALDYIHSGLIDLSAGEIVDYASPSSQSTTPSILPTLEPVLKQAISAHAQVYIFGSEYSDPASSGKPAVTGIHDVHMNQGSTGSFSDDNAAKSDGALIIYIQDQGNAGSGQWVGVFLAFASQASQTDDTGNAVSGSPDLASIATS
jgi:uncharacterized protein YukJ